MSTHVGHKPTDWDRKVARRHRIDKILTVVLFPILLAMGIATVLIDKHDGLFPPLWKRIRKFLLCYREKALRRAFGEDRLYDLAMELGHRYLLDMPRARQLSEIKHIKVKIEMLESADLIDKAFEEQWCNDYFCTFADAKPIRQGKTAARWRAYNCGPLPFATRAFSDHTYAELEGWWHDELFKLSMNIRGVWEGLAPTCDLALVPPDGLCSPWKNAKSREKSIEKYKLREAYALLKPEERYLAHEAAICGAHYKEHSSSDFSKDVIKRFSEWLARKRHEPDYGEARKPMSYGQAMKRIKRRKKLFSKPFVPHLLFKNPANTAMDRRFARIAKRKSEILSRDFRSYAFSKGWLSGITGTLDISDDELARRIAVGMDGYDILGGYEERIVTEYAIAAYGLPGLMAKYYNSWFDNYGKVYQSLYGKASKRDAYLYGYGRGTPWNYDEYGALDYRASGGLMTHIGCKDKREAREQKAAIKRYCAWRRTRLYFDPEYVRATMRRKLEYSYMADAIPVLDAMSDEEVVEKFHDISKPSRKAHYASRNFTFGNRNAPSFDDGRKDLDRGYHFGL